MANDFEILTASSVDEVGAESWDRLSAGRPFQSARWYRFGERVMSDCNPLYIILGLGEEPVARGTFWLIRQEPLPVPALLRSLLAPLLRRWPLLICRSPLSNTSGLILPEGLMRAHALDRIAAIARAEASRRRCSFLLFDFLEAEESKLGWPPGFTVSAVPEPGTSMTRKWDDFETYLKFGGRKNRQNYMHSLREARKLGLQIERRSSVPDVDQALRLVRRVEREHKSAANPWIRNMLINLPSVSGTYVMASLEDRLAGCCLIFQDGDTQLGTALGHAREVPYVYFLLLYTCLQDAFEKQVRRLSWGSGSYPVKRRMGFELEHNNYVVFWSSNRVIHALASRMKV